MSYFHYFDFAQGREWLERGAALASKDPFVLHNLAMAKKLALIVKEEVQRISLGEKSRGLLANGSWIKIKRNTSCPVCQGTYAYLQGKKERIVKFCGSSRYQFTGGFDFAFLKKRLHGKGAYFIYEDFAIFPERILVKASSEKEAKKKFAKIIGC